MRKLFNIFLLTVIMVSSNIFTSCGGKERYSNYDDTIKNANSIVETNTEVRHSTPLTEDSSNPKSESYVGTYEFTDEINNSWVLILNSDETATIGKKGSDKVAYGSIEDWKNGEVWVRFHDEVPMIWFPSGEKPGSQMPLVNGYLYYNKDSSDAKNPRNRLPVTKIK